MPSEKHPKAKSVESLRHAEYYGMQRTFDELYARSQAGEVFDNLMELILSKDNIMLAYRNIKSNSGSATPGTDRLRITDIGRLPADEVVARVRKIVRGGTNGYTPRSVRRKEIPKPNGKTRPLGIPCIWDRLIQQCISKSWSQSAKQNSAVIAMDSVRIGRLKMQSLQSIALYRGQDFTM